MRRRRQHDTMLVFGSPARVSDWASDLPTDDPKDTCRNQDQSGFAHESYAERSLSRALKSPEKRRKSRSAFMRANDQLADSASLIGFRWCSSLDQPNIPADQLGSEMQAG